MEHWTLNLSCSHAHCEGSGGADQQNSHCDHWHEVTSVVQLTFVLLAALVVSSLKMLASKGCDYVPLQRSPLKMGFSAFGMIMQIKLTCILACFWFFQLAV